MSVILVITSTAGDGDPPSNAEDVHAFLMSADAPMMPGVNFSVCGLIPITNIFASVAKTSTGALKSLGPRELPLESIATKTSKRPGRLSDSVLAGLKQVGDAPLAVSQATVNVCVDESVGADIDELDSVLRRLWLPNRKTVQRSVAVERNARQSAHEKSVFGCPRE